LAESFTARLIELGCGSRENVAVTVEVTGTLVDPVVGVLLVMLSGVVSVAE
jgi:hypothetical protein